MPQWLHPHLPQPPDDGPTMLSRNIVHRGSQAARFGPGTERTWSGHPYSHTVGVCRDCNSGWMSRREASVQPFLVRMMRGERVELDYEQVSHLAVWAVLRASVIDLLESDVTTLSSDYRRWLIDTAILPWATGVWAGHLPEPAAAVWLSRVAHGFVIAGDETQPTQVLYSTLWIGRLFLLTTVMVDLASVEHELVPLVSLWPPCTGLIWPPPTFAHDRQVRFLDLMLGDVPAIY